MNNLYAESFDHWIVYDLNNPNGPTRLESCLDLDEARSEAEWYAEKTHRSITVHGRDHWSQRGGTMALFTAVAR